MQRIHRLFEIDDFSSLKNQLLIWGNKHQTVVWLDSNNHKKSNIEGVLAVDKMSYISSDYMNAFEHLKEFINSIRDYAFGYLSYDLKNDTEKLSSNNIDDAAFPDLYFFQPKKIIEVCDQGLLFKYPTHLENEIDTDWKAIQNTTKKESVKKTFDIQQRTSRESYLKQVKKAIDEIHKGEVYEINLCQEFFAKNAEIDPLDTYLDLNSISKTPFATFLRMDDKYLLSASPERFLQKKKTILTSEPIKGTAKRENTPEKDASVSDTVDTCNWLKVKNLISEGNAEAALSYLLSISMP